ncbi:MAG TPA: hypothetical protein VKU41_02305 [Polyangiaceae bacterium]|nr:hypothetical protein [Polyangiaceae bacterium]
MFEALGVALRRPPRPDRALVGDSFDSCDSPAGGGRVGASELSRERLGAGAL